MPLSLEMDLTRCLEPRHCVGAGFHPAQKPPAGELDRRRGLRFPLTEGAFAFASADKLDDARGAVEVEFSLDEADGKPGAMTLVQAFGQYGPFLAIESGCLALTIYGRQVRMLVTWVAGRRYRVCASWDHTAGAALELRAPGRPVQRLERRFTWRAWRQGFVPFAIGGILTGHRFATWQETFRGHVRAVRAWTEPVDPPCPRVTVAETPAARGFPRHRDVVLLDLDDPPVADSPLRHDSIPDRLADLRKTARVLDAEKIVGDAATEMEAFARICRYVADLWPHCNYWPFPENEQRHIFWKRGWEMLPKLRKAEMGGMCGGYAHVMEEVFWSLGIDARRIQVVGHSSFETWSNQHAKWMILDASFGESAFYFIDGDGVPLSCGDLIHRHERRARDPHAFDDVRQAVVRADGAVDPRPTNVWQGFSHLGVGFGDPYPNQGGRPHYWYFAPCDRPVIEGGMNCGADERPAKKLDDLYWSCHRVRVKPAWHKAGESINLAVEPFQVTFPDGFEKRVDDGAWEACGAKAIWELHPGVNAIALRARNQLGARGRPWRAQVWRRP